MSDWKLPWAGACRCGQVRVAVTAPPLIVTACHCAGCQKMTASAFTLTVTVPSEGFAVTAGEPVIGGLHGPMAHHFFCPHCMSWMFTRAEGMDWFVNLRASVLDDHAWVEPFAEVWTSEKLAWVRTPAKHSYATQPDMDAYGALTQDFAANGARP
jgi:hypothetical protein